MHFCLSPAFRFNRSPKLLFTFSEEATSLTKSAKRPWLHLCHFCIHLFTLQLNYNYCSYPFPHISFVKCEVEDSKELQALTNAPPPPPGPHLPEKHCGLWRNRDSRWERCPLPEPPHWAPKCAVCNRLFLLNNNVSCGPFSACLQID